MNDKKLDEYLASLDEESFNEEFLKEFKKYEKAASNLANKYVKKLDNFDLKYLYGYLQKNHIHGFSNDTIFIGSSVPVHDDLIDDNVFCWNKIYAKGNKVIIEGNDYNLCLEIIESMKEAEMDYKIKFIEIDPYGKKQVLLKKLNNFLI